MNTRKFFLLFSALFFAAGSRVFADSGCVDYSHSAQALDTMVLDLRALTVYILFILNAGAGVLTLYYAIPIYSKVVSGEAVIKPLLHFLGAVLYLIGALIVLPVLFGINLTSIHIF